MRRGVGSRGRDTMPPVLKSRVQKVKQALRQKKEKPTRRSGRPPKVTEKLKELNNARGSTKKAKKELLDPVQASKILGAEYKEAKVVIKALSKSALQNQSRKYTFKKEPRVTLKRLGNMGAGSKKNTRVASSKLLRRRPGSARVTSNNNNSQSGLKKIVVKAEVVQSSSSPVPRKRGRPKRVNSNPEPVLTVTHVPVLGTRGKRKRPDTDITETKPREKRVRRTPRGSKQEEEDEEDESPEVKTKITRFDPTVMENLLDFGLKVQEVLSFNRKTLDKLLDNWGNSEPTTEEVEKKFEGTESGDLEGIMTWLEEEQRQRKEYQQELLETLRTSHKTNMALYSHMLTVLKSVTASA
ncbi:uncharacterized protein LOC127008413 isoform X3 [Eriocheir sinensis]|uniref:uncharacterized protein LOC127008413 isoform X3 n=2 Tax=Eriocheir sinensis TaxID=95602 RepID=UPI0021C5E81A|nr:uncharacterized protein LOC127008413 isoform X3 [Eriocheir sinensis]